MNASLFNKNEYIQLLKAVISLSRLYSDNRIPFLYYRAAENVFCKALNAKNLSRDDSAFDALYKDDIGIGLKTFTCPSNASTEKVAEFNKHSKQLHTIQDAKQLAIKLSELRNKRIKLAQRLYGTQDSMYHMVARRENSLILYETDYDLINIDKLNNVKETQGGIRFEDGQNEYSFNRSKSTLSRRFYIPSNVTEITVEILEDPFELLLSLIASEKTIRFADDKKQNVDNQVILPLYSTRSKQKKEVPERSGLNQWNARGRRRSIGEVYIAIPRAVHEKSPDFFPARDVIFNLQFPNGQIEQAKVCQDNSKALMTNPNDAMAHWLLRTLLDIPEGKLATIQHLVDIDCDSVVITKLDNNNFKIDKAEFGSYETYINM